MSTQYLLDVWNRLVHASPGDVMRGLLSSSAVCAVLAVAIVAAVVVARRGWPKIVAGAQRERIALGVIAIAVGAVWFIDIVLRGFVFDVSATVSWWRFAVAPAAAAAGLLTVALTLRTGKPRRVDGASMVTRRTWRTFGPRRGLLVLSVVASAAVLVAVIFGSMSAASDPGSAAHIALAAPNTDAPPVVTVFPGWAYGAPLIVSVCALVAAAIFALQRNAARPFSSHVAPGVERARRADLARGMVGIAAGATLLALAGLLRTAHSAVVTTTVTVTDVGRESVLSVQLPHSDLILLGGLVAPLLEIMGCVLLVWVVVGMVRLDRRHRRRPPAFVVAGVDA